MSLPEYRENSPIPSECDPIVGIDVAMVGVDKSVRVAITQKEYGIGLVVESLNRVVVVCFSLNTDLSSPERELVISPYLTHNDALDLVRSLACSWIKGRNIKVPRLPGICFRNNAPIGAPQIVGLNGEELSRKEQAVGYTMISRFQNAFVLVPVEAILSVVPES